MSFRRLLGLLVLWSASAAVIAAEPGACGAARETAKKVRTELEPGISPQARQAAAKTLSASAAAALLSGDLQLAAWAGLAAAEAAWNAKTVADAGVYLHYADRATAALQLLTCAHALGSRSPYLFEALATVHKAQGNAGAARSAIAEAQRLAPGDPLIELEASLIETGKPPPPVKPDANDALGRCIAALERHSQRVLAVRKQNHQRHDRLQNVDHRQKAFAGEAQIHRDLIRHVREVASLARRAGDALQHNLALAQCATAYFSFVTFLLDSYYGDRSGFELVFWADVLGLDAPAFVRDLPCGSPGNDCGVRVLPSNSLLSRQAEDRPHFGREEAVRQYRRDIDACNAIRGDSSGCRVRARARECATNKVLIEQWADARQQRVNAASRNFDNEARYVISLAEAEIGAAREFAVGLLRDLRKGGAALPGPEGKPTDAAGFAVWQINQVYTQTLLLQPHLLAGGKVEQFLGEQKRWFEREREGIESGIMSAKRSHDQMCEPVMLELRMEQLAEQYQAYLEHLRERMGWGVDRRVDTKFPCSFAIGGLSGKADLDDLGESKFAYELSRGPYAGSVELGKDGPSFSGSASGKIRGVGVSVDSDGAAGASGRYGPFAGKADASFTSAVNPWNGRQYLGIRLRGSAGFGIGNKSGSASASCYPSSGEVTIYPRALLEDVGRYLSAKSR
jgi:hypothetical protein